MDTDGEDLKFEINNEKPRKPDESECCGSGCIPCVFDVYEEQLKRYEEKKPRIHISNVLREDKFSPFVIINIDILSPQIKMFEFKPILFTKEIENEVLISDAKCGIDYEIIEDKLDLRAGHYLILKGEYETYTSTGFVVNNISRSYTPVLNGTNESSFKIIVVIYSDGKMSQFLKKLCVNDIVFWRGPYVEFMYETNSFKRILFFGAGTGVIPLYNIAKEIVGNDDEETIMYFIASFKSVHSFILREEFNKLQDYWNFDIDVYITSEENTSWNKRFNENISPSKLDKNTIFNKLNLYEKNKCFILICGPQSFNEFLLNTLLQYGINKENIYIFK